MLNKLSYSVTFPTTGRTLAGELNSSRDLGSLLAPTSRERASSSRWFAGACSGTALPGKAEDYKTLKATLQFSARAQSYVMIGPTRRRS